MRVLDGIAPYLMIVGGVILFFTSDDTSAETWGFVLLGVGGVFTLLARWHGRREP